MRRALGLVYAAVLWAAAPLWGQEAPFLALPLDCLPGESCYIEDYFDRVEETGLGDYTCGIKTRDGHRGTDFALTNWVTYENGVNVLAAAPGIVEATRDGMEDRPYSEDNAEKVGGRECGNAVRIRHENGLQTLYCHLRQGSVAVRPGDVAERGTVLGKIGMSGKTNYPHVHLSVLDDGTHLDPFAPNAAETCGETDKTLWLDPLAYTKTGMFTAGFSDTVPDFADVKSGAARRLEITATQPLVLYTHFFHAQVGDVLTLQVAGPEGSVFENTETLDAPKRSQFQAYGRKAPADGWAQGTYRGTATLQRDGQTLAVRFTDVTVR